MIPLLFGLTLAIQIAPIAPDVPVREPQMATNGTTVALTFGAGAAIYFATSADRGATFTTPRKIADATVLPLTRHRGPRIAFSGRTIVITAVTGKQAATGEHAHGLPSDGDLLAWRSTDGGATWSHAIIVNDVPGAPTEGLHSLAAGANGTLFAAWLDKRDPKGTSLYGARSTDGGVTWSKNVKIYQSPEGSICECCHPSVAIDAQGQILIMFRNWLAGSRDMYLTHSSDGATFSKPEKLGAGTWPLNACPMDGGGLTASGGKITTAWRRNESVFLDQPGHPETEIATGKDIALAVSAGKTYVVWTSNSAIESWTDGKKETLSKSGAFASLVPLPQGGVLAAWEENGGVQIRKLH